MSINRISAAYWAFGLGLFAGSIAGSVVSSRTPAQELQYVGVFMLVFGVAVYVLITRHWSLWQRKHPFVRFIIFLLSILVATVVLDGLAGLVFGGLGSVTIAAEVLAACAGFAITAWVTFLGGAERIWEEILARSDIEW